MPLWFIPILIYPIVALVVSIGKVLAIQGLTIPIILVFTIEQILG